MHNPTLEKLDERIDQLANELNGLVVESNKQLTTKIDTAVAAINTKFDGIDLTLTDVKALDFKAIKETLASREEYKELWAAQKGESDAIKALAEGGNADPEIQALLTQKGLDIVVSRAEIAKVLASKEGLKAALKKYPYTQGGGHARMLANLAYAYVLMAQNYKIARDHVTAVIAEKTLTDILLSVTIETLKAAIQAGLSALTAGVSGIISDAWLKELKLDAPSGEFTFTDSEGKSHTTDLTDQEDQVTGRKIGEGIAKAPIESGSGVLSGGLGSVVGSIGGVGGFVARATQLFSTDTPTNTTQDPVDFFMDKEAQLRKAAAFLASCTDPKVLSETKVMLDREYSLEELEKDPNWKYFFEVHDDYDALNEIWEQVGALLAVNMRRLCWRLFCRSQWNNTKYSYTITVVSPEETNKIFSEDVPATEWHYKMWAWSGLGWPRHWEKICSDFRGPEYDPDHVFTVKKGRVNQANEMLQRYAWISLAAVQCCQIKRHDANSRGQNWEIDLEKFSHVAGEEGGQHAVPSGWTDRELVYGDIMATKYLDSRDNTLSHLETYLRKIRVHSGMRAQITEILFGKEGSYGKATGKKGRLALPNSRATALPIVKGMKTTVVIKRVSSHGNETSSKHRALVHVYKALTTTHADGKECDKEDGEQLCWYCQNKTEAKISAEDFKTKYRLKEVDRGEQKNRVFSSVLSYANLPNKNKQGVALFGNEPGWYCIRLDPRWHLQNLMTDREYHVSDEWWFKILDKVDETKVPAPPKLSPGVERDHVAIEGEYKRRSDSPKITTKTLIHAFVDGKMYGPKEITEPNDDTTAVKWKIEGVDKFRGGEKISATVTWPATSTEGARQSLAKEAESLLVRAKPPDVDEKRLLAGTCWVSGTSDAAEGVLIRVYIGDAFTDTSVHAGEVKLQGARIDQEEEKDQAGKVIKAAKKEVIPWLVSGLPNLETGQKVVAQVWSNKLTPPSEKYTASSVKSDPKIVREVNAPEFDLAKPDYATVAGLPPGATSISGTTEAEGGLQIEFVMDGVVQTYYTDIKGPRDDKGKIPWSGGRITPLPAFKPCQKMWARVGYVKHIVNEKRQSKGVQHAQGWGYCSKKTEAVVLKLDKPAVDDPTNPGKMITGTAKVPENLEGLSEVWVSVADAWLDTAASYKVGSRAGEKISWQVAAPLTMARDQKVKAQIFEKLVIKGKDQAEWSAVSDEVSVKWLDKPEVKTAAVRDTKITGTALSISGATIHVQVIDKTHTAYTDLQHPAVVKQDGTWAAEKLKVKGAKDGTRAEFEAGKSKVKAALFIGELQVSDWSTEFPL